MKTSDAIGVVLTGTVVFGVIMLVLKINEIDDPCYPRNVERRQELIESHERCMAEANCIYEDWDIRRYDDRLEMQLRCEANRNED